ncbi:MAG: zinc-ribbon domain-containing protein, partial [Ruminococcus sp.]
KGEIYMYCQYCQALIQDNSTFCTNCGKPVPPQTAGAPVPQQNKVVRCANGHFFDAAKYEQCPHCGAASGVASTPQQPVVPTAAPSGKKGKKEKQKKPLFGFGFHKDKADMPQAASGIPGGGAAPNPYNQVNHTIALLDFEEEEPAPAAVQPAAPTPMNAKKAVTRHGAEPTPVQPAPAPVEQPKPAALQPDIPEEPVPQKQPVTPVSPAKTPAPQHKAPVREKQEESSKTIAIYSDLSDDEPVVGWLVCVKGAYFGQSFNLVAGKNLIGRSPMMDIALEDEDSISRNTHAIVIYEPKKRIFILQAGESKGLTYLNDDLILEYETLHAYDKIQLGECELLFVPFCNENFTWDSFKEA